MLHYVWVNVVLGMFFNHDIEIQVSQTHHLPSVSTAQKKTFQALKVVLFWWVDSWNF